MLSERRDFLAKLLAAGGAYLLAAEVSTASNRNKSAPPPHPLRVLILGGTGFLGGHYVRATLDRGHKVAVFSRGKTESALPTGVEVLTGDRNGNLASLRHREWDAVVDLATYGPVWVRTLGEALAGKVRHYTFISTIAVYDPAHGDDHGLDERSPLVTYQGKTDPYTLTTPEDQYSGLKVLCEREAEKQFPGKTLILRPCYIVGPGDRVGALTYWSARLTKGGEALAAGDPLSRIYLIDVRDMAEWTIRMAERGTTGIFNAVGPASPTNWGELLKRLRAISSASVKFTWVPLSWLTRHGVGEDSNLQFWSTSSGGMHILNEKVLAAGMKFRPLSTTVANTLAWYDATPPSEQRKWLLGVEGNQSLQESMPREKELLEAWHADADDAVCVQK